MRVSTEGGGSPKWRRDGRELFYVADGKLMVVDVKLGASPRIGTPHALFELPPWWAGYAPFADGRKFLFLERVGEPPVAKINLVLNWTAELNKK